MSRIGKGIKKVFRGAKKVLKKVAKPALMIGGAFFASGLALGGFSGFTSLMESTGSIFKAVGKTIGAGAQAIGGALGIGEGVASETLAQMGLEEGTTLGSGAFANLLGFGTPTTATRDIGAGNLPGYLRSKAGEEIADTARGQTQSGFFGRIFGGFNNLSDPAQKAIFDGIFGGISAYAASEEAKKERKRQRKRGIFGVPIGEEFGPGISPEDIQSNLQPMQYAFNPSRSGQMPAPPQSQPAPTQPYPNPYTTPPPPPSGRGPLLG